MVLVNFSIAAIGKTSVLANSAKAKIVATILPPLLGGFFYFFLSLVLCPSLWMSVTRASSKHKSQQLVTRLRSCHREPPFSYLFYHDYAALKLSSERFRE
jgi:hypothetical protein